MPVYETSLEYSQGEPLVNFWRHYRQKSVAFAQGLPPLFCPLLKHCYLWYTGDKGWGRVEAKPLFGERCLATPNITRVSEGGEKKKFVFGPKIVITEMSISAWRVAVAMTSKQAKSK